MQKPRFYFLLFSDCPALSLALLRPVLALSVEHVAPTHTPDTVHARFFLFRSCYAWISGSDNLAGVDSVSRARANVQGYCAYPASHTAASLVTAVAPDSEQEPATENRNGVHCRSSSVRGDGHLAILRSSTQLAVTIGSLHCDHTPADSRRSVGPGEYRICACTLWRDEASAGFVEALVQAAMKLKHFQSVLQGVKDFESPNFKLEQYKTSAHLAAVMLFTIQEEFGDIEDRVVADMGCTYRTVAPPCALV